MPHETIRFDPDYAPAQAALARVYSLATVVGVMNATESMPKARDAALRAIALDPTLAAGHSVLGLSNHTTNLTGRERNMNSCELSI